MAVTTVTTPVTTQEPEPQEYPSVSVIVPIYNGEADLPELLARLRGQRYPTDRYLHDLHGVALMRPLTVHAHSDDFRHLSLPA